MKVKMNRPWCYSGKADDLVFCYNRFSGRMYARKRVKPLKTAENERIGTISRNIFGINPSAGFRRDLQIYLPKFNALRENRSHPVLTWPAMYVRLMYAMAREMEGVSLLTLTREEVYSRNLPCISIKAAVDAGILPAVDGYERMDKLL